MRDLDLRNVPKFRHWLTFPVFKNLTCVRQSYMVHNFTLAREVRIPFCCSGIAIDITERCYICPSLSFHSGCKVVESLGQTFSTIHGTFTRSIDSAPSHLICSVAL